MSGTSSETSSEIHLSDTDRRRGRTRLIKQRDRDDLVNRRIVAGSTELLEQQLFGSLDAQDLAIVGSHILD